MLFIGEDITSLTFRDIIIYFILPLSAVIIATIIAHKITKHSDIKKRNKQKYNKKLMDEILKPLSLLNIRYKDFKIWIDGLDVLEKKGDLFESGLQYIKKKNKSILLNLEKSKNFINEMNVKLINLKRYLNDNIESDYTELISFISKDVIRYAFSTDKIRIMIKKIENNNIILSFNETLLSKIPCLFGIEKTKKIISDLIENNEFIKYFNELHYSYIDSKNELEIFSNGVTELIKRMDRI